MHIKKAMGYMEELIDTHPHALYVEAWSCIEKELAEALKPSHNSRVMPCAHWVPGGICNVFVDYRCGKDKSCIISARA